MKAKLRFKIIWESTITRVILILSLVLILILAIILPLILNSRPKGSVIAFNRDVTSGTREAFIENVLNKDSDEFSPGSNVLEASNNESMIKSVEKNKYSTGYVSFGTVAEFDENGNPKLKDDIDSSEISFATLNGISPTKENILNGNYSGQRNFNMFLRVEEGSDEYSITTYDYENNIETEDVTDLNDTLKASALFYNWILHSEEALNVYDEGFPPLGIDPFGELPIASNQRYVMDEEYLETYVQNTDITENNINIEIVGSSSASELIIELSDIFAYEVNSIYPNSVYFTIATNGSSDAFNKNVPGVDNSYIGLQSREPDSSELKNWGYETVDSNIYNPFSIDAILIIYNNSHLNNEEKSISYNVTSKDLDYLYESNDIVMWNDLFTYENGGDK